VIDSPAHVSPLSTDGPLRGELEAQEPADEPQNNASTPELEIDGDWNVRIDAPVESAWERVARLLASQAIVGGLVGYAILRERGS